jgi:hypothetical protein
VKWDVIVAIEDTPKSTLVSRMAKYAPSVGASSEKDGASINDDDGTGGGDLHT